MFRSALALLLLLSLSACNGYPRDARDSGERARDAMRVGVSHDPPFVDARSGDTPAGDEVALVTDFARAGGLQVEWIDGGHDALMDALLAGQLHMVIGGHTADSPWQDVGWSREFQLRDPDAGIATRRIALPPGENAWAVQVDRYLHARERAR